jgi:uncharacterized protein YwqG
MNLREACEQYGLGRLAGKLAELERACLMLEGRRAKDSGIAAGKSKLGGLPDLPTPELWPRGNDGHHLNFLAQINFRSTVALPNTPAFPERGVLFFFYDIETSPWGHDPDEASQWRVLYVEDERTCGKCAPPEEIEYDDPLSSQRISPRVSKSFPSHVEAQDCGLDVREDEAKAYYQVLHAVTGNPDRPVHQMLGWPGEIQPGGAMQLCCQVASNGFHCESSRDYLRPEVSQIADGWKDWQLLLQLDSDDKSDMMWHDVGRLYFWIREQDLRERKFGSTWVMLQCY